MVFGAGRGGRRGGGGNQEKKRSQAWVLQTGALAISAGTATAMAIVWILMQHSLEIHKSKSFLFLSSFHLCWSFLDFCDETFKKSLI